MHCRLKLSGAGPQALFPFLILNNMLQKIFDLVSANKNVLLVGKTNSGKTYFITNELIPFFGKNGKQAIYISSMNEEINPTKDSIVILDEFEILDDRVFLEHQHPEETPFYSNEYLECIDKWLAKADKIKNTCVYVVTRNKDVEIENIKRISKFSFSDDIEVLEFKNGM